MGTAHLRDRSRYRRATELYATGREHVLKSGDVIWLQAMNTLEKDEAVADAQAARARLALALRDEQSEEQLKVRVLWEADGREKVIERLRDTHYDDAYIEAVDDIEADEEWAERVAMIRRGPDLLAVASPDEEAFYKRTLLDFAELLEKRIGEILAREEDKLHDLPDEELWKEYLHWWADLRGNEVGLTEYRFTELFFAARACVGVEVDGKWDHSECEEHRVRIYDSKDELRVEPDDFTGPLFATLVEMEVTERDAKRQAALASSSDSSAPQSQPVDSEPSSPEETPSAPPGI